MRLAKSIDLTRVTYKHVLAGGEDQLVVQYKVRNAFGRKAGRFQLFATGSDEFAIQSHHRSNGTVHMWDEESQGLKRCEGGTERVDRRRDLVTQRVPASCLGGTTEGAVFSMTLLFPRRGNKMAYDDSGFREFSWGSPTVE